ncbi:MAG: phosphopantothenoylcysteine decarboxylase [Phycisphaerales bacterium]|nr:phosphopantothenoylcysteine decarboxylase [Phycisphaerales bacterium]
MARILITAGPTYEPIDAVRFIGNRSSGKLGSNLADRALELGWEVRLLLGPNAQVPDEQGVEVVRFQSCQDLEDALAEHLDWCDCLVMAAAVADYRPKPDEVNTDGKRRRTGDDLNIALESTPDLLAGCSKNARQDQLLVGFALEPRDRLESSALKKLAKKDIDLIVANPLETMDSNTIDARLIGNESRGLSFDEQTDGPMSKEDFASWLLGHLDALVSQRCDRMHSCTESN